MNAKRVTVATLKAFSSIIFYLLMCGSGHAGGPVLKVTILTSNTVLLDGEPTTLPALEARIAEAKRDDGEVWYYREDQYYFPSDTALGVFDLLIKHQMKTSLSSKPDFSDFLDKAGISHQRTRSD